MAGKASTHLVSNLRGWLRRITAMPGPRGRFVAIAGLVVVAGSLAAAAALQMHLDRMRIDRLGEAYDRNRAAEVAAFADASLSRYEAIGLLFANGGLAEEAVAALPGIRGIAVSDTSGQSLRHSGTFLDMPALASMMRRDREVIRSGDHALIVFRNIDRIIAVSFEASRIVPADMLRDAELMTPVGTVLCGRASGKRAVVVPAGTWPVRVRASVRDASALSPRFGASALYVFLIVGPLAAGLWLSGLFLQELEWRVRAGRVVRALRLTYPREAKLRMRLAACERERNEVLRDRSALFAEVCRRMCTPLNAAVGFAEMIEKKFCGPLGNAKYAEYAKDIRTSGSDLHGRLAEVCELSEIEAGRVALNWKVCDVTELVSDCIGDNAGRAFLRRIWLEMAPADAVPVRVDPDAVRRILTALVRDALRRTPRGGKVRLRVETRPECVTVWVEDSDRNSRAAAWRDSVRIAQHLDLAVAGELARLMGGRLQSSETAGRGRRFRLDLPASGLPAAAEARPRDKTA